MLNVVLLIGILPNFIIGSEEGRRGMRASRHPWDGSCFVVSGAWDAGCDSEDVPWLVFIVMSVWMGRLAAVNQTRILLAMVETNVGSLCMVTGCIEHIAFIFWALLRMSRCARADPTELW